ncbi:glycosyltransferase family 2 protein [Patescibacteria group bacterium AH-259-L07]|nr:glycosyltransferase family 2 protein [Patescibacteria group bacterium AH-259-L07]
MRLSIIIVNYNTKELLKDCLESIFENNDDADLEVIVVDNNSTDSTEEFLKRSRAKDLRLKIILNSQNKGFAIANNQGAKLAKGKILLFLNPDTIIKEDIFQRIINIFKHDSKIGIVSPQLILPDGSDQPWAYGKGWVSGAAMAIRSSFFKRINGFDERFFMYFEDKDLCQRVGRLGYKVMVLPDIKVVHLGGKSLASNRIRKKFYYTSQSYYWRKRYGLMSALFLRLIRWPYKIYILHFKK